MWYGLAALFLVFSGFAGGGLNDAWAVTGENETLEPSAQAGEAPVDTWEEDGVREEYRQGFTRLTVEDILGRGGYRYSLLQDPPRLVVDIQNPTRSLSWNRVPLKGDAFVQLRVGRYADKIRLVLDCRESPGREPRVRAENGSLIIVSAGPDVDPSGGLPMGGPERPVNEPVQVTAMDFHYDNEASDVVVKTAGEAAYDVLEQDGRIVILFSNAVIPDHLQRAIDTRGFASAVVAIQPGQKKTADGQEASVTIQIREKTPYRVLREGETVRVRIQNPESKPAAVAALPKPDLSQGETGRVKTQGVQTPVSAVNQTAAARGTVTGAVSEARGKKPSRAATKPEKTKYKVPAKGYRGRKISLDFKDADIQNVLRLIAEVSGKNIVISEAVQGKVTIRLMNVPWDMALDVILKTYALDDEELGPNILRVAPYSQLKTERTEALQAAKALEQVEDLVTEVVTLNYARAQNIQGMLEKMKSQRSDAAILVDQRTNSLVLKDLPATIAEMIGLIQDLDRQTPQVLIEAKIVELDVDFERALGIQWGTGYQAGPATGNPTGMNFPGTATVGGVADNVSGITPTGISNPVVNLPAAIDTTAGGALGFSLASITNSFRLDMQLSALEKRKHARILSSPRVATLNNQEARIEQGQEVPFQTTSDEGTKTEFKDAMLRLFVTPQINFDKSIIMKIIVSNDTPIRDPTVGFIIGKKEAATTVLVNDGETAVIGGIYTDDEQRTTGGVPWLMDIPGIGYLFKTQGKNKKRTELLIFITPQIIPARVAPVGEWVVNK